MTCRRPLCGDGWRRRRSTTAVVRASPPPSATSSLGLRRENRVLREEREILAFRTRWCLSARPCRPSPRQGVLGLAKPLRPLAHTDSFPWPAAAASNRGMKLRTRDPCPGRAAANPQRRGNHSETTNGMSVVISRRRVPLSVATRGSRRTGPATSLLACTTSAHPSCAYRPLRSRSGVARQAEPSRGGHVRPTAERRRPGRRPGAHRALPARSPSPNRPSRRARPRTACL